MKRSVLAIASLLVTLVLATTACSSTAGPQPTYTPLPTYTPYPTEVPPTATPEPTSTPVITSAPAITVKQVMAAFEAAGLPLTDIESYTAATDPNSLLGRPGQYIDKANWSDLRATDTLAAGSNSIEIFTSSS